jgi:hypothetical protein
MANNRFDQILNSIKNSLDKSCCQEGEEKSLAGYEYECKRCGLVLEFNRNQPNAKCPNDGSTMYRID